MPRNRPAIAISASSAAATEMAVVLSSVGSVATGLSTRSPSDGTVWAVAGTVAKPKIRDTARRIGFMA
jgi:hypothetical protein